MIADDLIAAFEPWMTDDLADYLAAAGTMFSEVERIALWDGDLLALLGVDPDDLDADESYGLLLDPDQTTAQALPYLAQFVGERFPMGIDEDAQREWVKDRPNSRRGTMVSLANAAQRSLTGNRAVTIVERSDGATAADMPDDVAIYTYAYETPDPAQVARDIADTFPLELSLHYQVTTATTWQQVALAGEKWSDTAQAPWLDLLTKQQGGIYFGK